MPAGRQPGQKNPVPLPINRISIVWRHDSRIEYTSREPRAVDVAYFVGEDARNSKRVAGRSCSRGACWRSLGPFRMFCYRMADVNLEMPLLVLCRDPKGCQVDEVLSILQSLEIALRRTVSLNNCSNLKRTSGHLKKDHQPPGTQNNRTSTSTTTAAISTMFKVLSRCSIHGIYLELPILASARVIRVYFWPNRSTSP